MDSVCFRRDICMEKVRELISVSREAEMQARQILCGCLDGKPALLHLRGGKGIACTTGVILAVCPPAVICCAVGFLIIVGITRYVSVGSIFLVSAYLVQAIIFGQLGWLKISGASRIEFYILSACFTGMAIWRHRANIVRLMNGTENKFGTKKGDK